MNPNHQSLREFLVKNTVFKHLAEEQLELILLESGTSKYKKGTIIYEEGSRIGGFYILYNGIIKIFKTGIDGKEQIIRFAKPGDVMGFRSTITGELACTTAKTIESSEIIFVPGTLVISLVKTNSEFAFDLLRIACSELGEANDYITDIAQKTVKERLAEVLIQLKMSFGLDRENYIRISLTREEIAGIVGTSTESIIRMLSDFKNEGLIGLQGRKIKIIGDRELVRLGNVNYH